MSNFYSNNIRVPLVSYTVEGQTYKVAGPRFAEQHNCVTFNVGLVLNLLSNRLQHHHRRRASGSSKNERRQCAAQNAMAARYPVGKTVDVFYDPAAPKHAFVERDAPMPKTVATLLVAVCGAETAMGLVMAIIGGLILAPLIRISPTAEADRSLSCIS